MAKPPRAKSESSSVRLPSTKSSGAAPPAKPEDSGSDDSSDQDYQEDSADEDEDLQPDLQTDALFLIDKIMSETGELGDGERERIRKDLERLDEEDAENEWNDNEDDEQENDKEDEEEKDDEGEKEDEQEEDVPLSEVEYDDDADLVPFQKLTVYNRPALTQAVSTTRESGPTTGGNDVDARFWDHLSLTTLEPVTMRDVFDDLIREQAFMNQALDAATRAKAKLEKEKIKVGGNAIRVGCVPEGEMVKSTEEADAEADDQQFKRQEPASKTKSLKRKRSGKGKGKDDGYDEEFQTMVEQAEAELGNEAQQNAKRRQFGSGSSSSAKHSKTGGPRTEEKRERFKPGRGGSAAEGRHRGGPAGDFQSRRPGASGSTKGSAGGGKPKKRLGKSKRSGRA